MQNTPMKKIAALIYYMFFIEDAICCTASNYICHRAKIVYVVCTGKQLGLKT